MRFYQIQFHCIKMRYSVKLRDRIYVKGYGFLSFVKNVGKDLSNKYGQKLLDSTKKSTTDAIKTASKTAIQKAAEATGNLLGNKIADKITTVWKKSSVELRSTELHSQNDGANSEVEIPKKDTYLQNKGNKLFMN